MSTLHYRHLVSGGLITTYLCSSTCAHCVYRSSPRRQRAHIHPEMAANAFRVARSLGCRSMHIGGGEPFLDVETLLRVLEAARDEHMGIDYIETNSSWFQQEESALEILREVRHRGCRTLLLSIDPFHNAFIPLRKIRGTMQACRRLGIEIFPWRLEFLDDIARFDEAVPHDLATYEATYGPDYIRDLETRYGVNLGGRALTTFRNYHPRRPLPIILEQGTQPCTILANTHHFHMDLYGDFIPTHCPGFGIAWHHLGGNIDPAIAPALTTLYAEGPTALYHRARPLGFIPRQEGYISPCDLCDHLRTFLAVQASETFPDLRPTEFYTVDAED